MALAHSKTSLGYDSDAAKVEQIKEYANIIVPFLGSNLFSLLEPYSLNEDRAKQPIEI